MTIYRLGIEIDVGQVSKLRGGHVRRVRRVDEEAADQRIVKCCMSSLLSETVKCLKPDIVEVCENV